MRTSRQIRTRGTGTYVLILAASLYVHAQQVGVSGAVHDPSGAAIAGANVVLHSGQFTTETKTNSAGEFSFSEVRGQSGTVRVERAGFSPAEMTWSTTSGPADLQFVLRVLPAKEELVISAARTEMKLSEAPGSAVLLSSDDIAANPAVTLDDMLRQVPGFSLFRRSSSRISNPTSQGVSLRGVGASGPSRALVLQDGVPLVDPFGGWVYWDRIPRAELASVEVFRGGASSLYGSDAMGGVVQFLVRTPEAPAASLDFSYGNEDTPDLSAWAGTVFSRWDVGAGLDMSRTDGYILVPSSQRGMVDRAANSEHATLDASAGYHISENSRAFLRGTFFDEARHNGTLIQKNSTGTLEGAAGMNDRLSAHDSFSARLFGQTQGYDQTFSAILNNRASERLTNDQHVPSQQLGGAAQWDHIWREHTLIGGADLQEIIGASDEQLFSGVPATLTANKTSGGRQRMGGIFGEDIVRVGAWTVVGGARWDHWNNFQASTVTTPVATGIPAGKNYADRIEDAFSPRFSLLRSFGANLSWSISGYRSFRAPTLNELYRSFQQGNTLTLNNSQLRAERLTGAETGLRTALLNHRLELRGTLFWGDVVNPITNVTLNPNSNPILRQRQNLGRTRSIGTEADGRFRLTGTIEFSAGYQYTHATVVESSAALIGLNLPQVPRHQVTWEFRYWRPELLMLSVQGRYSGAQFDDDLNTLRLDHYYVMDVFAGREIAKGIQFYVAAENLLNQRYAVALTPVENLGPPVLARAGVRINFPRNGR